MKDGVTRRELFLIVEAGAATAAFAGCAVLRGGAPHPVLDPTSNGWRETCCMFP